MAYAIMRIEKLKTTGAIAASGSHMMRSRPTSNADPARTSKNKILTGTADPAADVAALLGDGPQRKNGVLALEILCTTSPEWWPTATREQKTEWMRSTQDWLRDTFGQENLAHVQLHLDETTPHITGLIVPRDPASGRLNAARWMDGSAKLAALQDGYAERVKGLGLARGLEGSKATHTTVAQFYGAMQGDAPEVPAPKVETPPAMMREATRTEWAEQQSQRLAKRQARAVGTLTSQARSAVLTERRVAAYQAAGEAMREAAQAARDIPLQEVAQRLQLERVKGDRSKWRDPEGLFTLSIDGQRWYDHRNERGGGGAIDLVQHILSADFKQAVAWLGHHAGEQPTVRAVAARALQTAERTVRAAVAERPPFVPPTPAAGAQESRARRYMIETRSVPAPVVARAVAAGDLYTDARGNAVLLMRDAAGQVQGAELRGTGTVPFHGLAPGSSREAVFSVPTRSGVTPEHLVLVESATDALSYAALHPQENALVVSTAGARPALPSAVAARLAEFSTVTVAYDNDAPGRTTAEKLIELLRQLGRAVRSIAPTKGKDWNDDLKAARAAQEARQDLPPSTSAPTAAAAATEAPGRSRGPR